MNITISHIDDTLTVRLEGALDYTTSAQMETLITDINAIRAPKVVFELGRVSHVDSVGLGMLHLAKDEIVTMGETLVLRGATGTVRRLFEITDSAADFVIE